MSGPELTGPPAQAAGPFPRSATIFSHAGSCPFMRGCSVGHVATVTRPHVPTGEPAVVGATAGSRAPRSAGGARRSGQVVDGRAAHGLRGEVRLDPCRDLRTGVAAAPRLPGETSAATTDEAVDLAGADVALDLRQGGGWVAAVEAAARH